jgi:uncharacterized surface protein with fasciclin (FAS1) repeats
MRITKTIAASAVGAALAAGAVAASPAEASHQRTIADVLLSDSRRDDANGFDRNWHDYDIVTQAVLAFDDLTEAASNPDAELTVFAPTDRAFKKLVSDLGVQTANEQQVFDAVLTLGLDTVKAVLQYHILGFEVSRNAAFASDGAVVDTLTPIEPGTIEVDKINGIVLRLVDADRDDADALVWRWNTNIGGQLANGYIHGITEVLRPVDL